jgi:predicted acylesterase/phospholipase RssA
MPLITSNDSTSPPKTSAIALCLSGGGFRATFYHLGVIRLLLESGLLRKVTHICSVSGGSILAAHLCQNWKRYNEEDLFRAACNEIIEFSQKDIRGSIVRRFILRILLVGGIALTWWGRTRLLINYLDVLYKQQTLSNLSNASNERPELRLLTTSMRTGELCWFSNNGFTRSKSKNLDQAFKNTLIPIGKAVAASAAFPPMFPPVILLEDEVGAKIKDEFGDELLTDGGVYDNLGFRHLDRFMKMLNKTFDLVVISDASKEFDWTKRKRWLYKWIFFRTTRSTEILMNRIADLEADNIIAGQKNNTILHVKITDQVDVSATQQHVLSHDIQTRTATLRTDLDKFSNDEIRALVQHGYETAFAKINNALKVSTLDIKMPSGSEPIWNPIPSEDVRGAAELDRIIKQGRHRNYFFWNNSDWTSYAIAAVLVIYIAISIAYFHLNSLGAARVNQTQQEALRELTLKTSENIAAQARTHLLATERKRLIVFISSAGDQRYPWTNKETGTYWPELVRNDKDFADFDVKELDQDLLKMGYLTIADRMVIELIDILHLPKYDEAYFITAAPSGGVIGKQIAMQLDEKHFSKIKALFIFSSTAPIERYFTDRSTLMGALFSFSLPFLKMFMPLENLDFYEPQRIREHWKNRYGHLNIRRPLVFCAVPTLRTVYFPMVIQVEDPNNFRMREMCEGPVLPIAVKTDEINKPSNSEDIAHMWVKARILEIALHN